MTYSKCTTICFVMGKKKWCSQESTHTAASFHLVFPFNWLIFNASVVVIAAPISCAYRSHSFHSSVHTKCVTFTRRLSIYICIAYCRNLSYTDHTKWQTQKQNPFGLRNKRKHSVDKNQVSCIIDTPKKIRCIVSSVIHFSWKRNLYKSHGWEMASERVCETTNKAIKRKKWQY